MQFFLGITSWAGVLSDVHLPRKPRLMLSEHLVPHIPNRRHRLHEQYVQHTTSIQTEQCARTSKQRYAALQVEAAMAGKASAASYTLALDLDASTAAVLLNGDVQLCQWHCAGGLNKCCVSRLTFGWESVCLI